MADENFTPNLPSVHSGRNGLSPRWIAVEVHKLNESLCDSCKTGFPASPAGVNDTWLGPSVAEIVTDYRAQWQQLGILSKQVDALLEEQIKNKKWMEEMKDDHLKLKEAYDKLNYKFIANEERIDRLEQEERNSIRRLAEVIDAEAIERGIDSSLLEAVDYTETKKKPGSARPNIYLRKVKS